MLLYAFSLWQKQRQLLRMLHCWACTVCYKKMAVRSIVVAKVFWPIKGPNMALSPALGIFSEDLDFIRFWLWYSSWG